MPQGPKFNYFDLKQCKQGEVYRVEVSSALNVLLVDASGFSAFKAGRQHRYWGGLITRSPHDFVIPRSGHWYLIYHAWGLRSGGRISIRPLVEAQAMPRATPNIVSLRSIAEAAADYPGADDAPPVAPAERDMTCSSRTQARTRMRSCVTSPARWPPKDSTCGTTSSN